MWRRHAAPTRELNAFIDIDSMHHVQQVYTLQPEVPPFFAEHAQSTLGICAQVLKEPSTACNTEDYSYKKGRQKLLLSHCCGAVGAASLLFLMLFWCVQVRAAGGFGAWIPGWVVARRDGAFWRSSLLQGTCLVGLCLHSQRRGPQFERQIPVFFSPPNIATYYSCWVATFFMCLPGSAHLRPFKICSRSRCFATSSGWFTLIGDTGCPAVPMQHPWQFRTRQWDVGGCTSFAQLRRKRETQLQSLVLVAMQFAKSVENWSIDTEGTIKYQRRHFVHPLHAGPAHIRSALHPRALLSRDASPVGNEHEFVFACLAMCITYEVHVLACRGTAPSILPIWLKHSLHSLAYTSLGFDLWYWRLWQSHT